MSIKVKLPAKHIYFYFQFWETKTNQKRTYHRLKNGNITYCNKCIDYRWLKYYCSSFTIPVPAPEELCPICCGLDIRMFLAARKKRLTEKPKPPMV
jgi:hypothetical protein